MSGFLVAVTDIDEDLVSDGAGDLASDGGGDWVSDDDEGLACGGAKCLTGGDAAG